MNIIDLEKLQMATIMATFCGVGPIDESLAQNA
jgi:hypothetical protein